MANGISYSPQRYEQYFLLVYFSLRWFTIAVAACGSIYVMSSKTGNFRYVNVVNACCRYKVLVTKIVLFPIWSNLTVEFQNIHIQFDKSLVLFLLSICYMCNRIRFVAHGKCWCLLDSCSDLWFSIQPSVDRSMASGPVSSVTSFTDVKSKKFSKTVIKNRLTASVRPESMSSPRSSLPYSEPSASQLVVV